MKIRTCLFLCAMLWPTWSYASVLGTYHVDKAKLLADMKMEIQKLPEKRRAFGRMALVMAESLEMSFTLAPKGQATMVMTMKIFGKSKTKEGKGHWTQTKENGIRIKTQSKDAKGRVVEDTLQCTPADKGQFSCINVSKRGKRKAIFFTKGAPQPAKSKK